LHKFSWRILYNLHSRHFFFFSRTVEAADKIVVLKDGMVAEQGKPEDLMNTGGEFAKMVNLQSESAKWAVAGTVTNKR
jgi:ATP-binding cassette subfamily B protein